MRSKLEDNTLTLYLEGRLGVDDAQTVRGELMDAIAANPGADIVLDAGDLEYIASSGLRVLSALFKKAGRVPIVNVCPDVYNVFEITGFTALTRILRKPREISLDGCEVIGQGASATVYRMDEETVVKIFVPAIGIERIERERENAKAAFVSGLPYSCERYLTGAVPSNLGQFGVKGDLPNPGLLLARHFTNRLREQGVEVAKEPTYLPDYNPLLPHRNELYIHYSDSLAELIKETNVNSNNLYAESLFRYLGARYTLPGTIHNSQEILRDYWRRRGVSVQNAIIKDGCGLAPQDAVSAKAFVQLLTIMYRSKNAEAWINSLPVSGETGTLTTLCPKTPLEGRIHAKSGTIAGTKNFAGYIDMPNGDTWVFAILINSAPGKAKKIQNVIQQYLLDVYKEHQ